uniref:Uncharacterized protein n=1 Tax=Amphimedon queenslandica TaxID=400682 RepID=A0A1X7UYB7_AMPQE
MNSSRDDKAPSLIEYSYNGDSAQRERACVCDYLLLLME